MKYETNDSSSKLALEWAYSHKVTGAAPFRFSLSPSGFVRLLGSSVRISLKLLVRPITYEAVGSRELVVTLSPCEGVLLPDFITSNPLMGGLYFTESLQTP